MRLIQIIPPNLAVVASTYGLARYTYGLFLPDIRTDLELSSATLGAIASGSYAAFLLATFISSSITGRVGPRLPTVLGGLSAALGMLMIALSPNSWLLAVGVFIAGTSPGWAYPAVPEAVARTVPKKVQSQTLTWINSGTGFGVLLAGPVALWAGEAWRLAWVVFAIFALAATTWNVKMLPRGGSNKAGTKLPRLRWSWFVCPRSGPLFLSALVLGITTSVYWTFAVDFIVTSGSLQASIGKIFWTVVGVAGIAGAFAGDLVPRFGLRRTSRWTIVGQGVSISLLALSPASWPNLIGSALLFGAGFIMVTGLFAVWSVNVFYERPSAGFGATFLLISLGQLVGPFIVGILISQVGLALMFYAAAVLTVGAAFLQPKEEVWSAAP